MTTLSERVWRMLKPTKSIGPKLQDIHSRIMRVGQIKEYRRIKPLIEPLMKCVEALDWYDTPYADELLAALKDACEKMEKTNGI